MGLAFVAARLDLTEAPRAISAPTLSISGAADVGDTSTLMLSADITGGNYDSIEYLWEVLSGGGSFDDTAAQEVVYTPAIVEDDTEVEVQVTVTVRGTGTLAVDGTSAAVSATETFTVSHVTNAVYQMFVDAGFTVLHARLGPSYATGSDRVMYDPSGDRGTVSGAELNMNVPANMPNAPTNFRIRRGGSHQNRITFGFGTGAVNPAEYLYNSGSAGRYIYVVTLDTHESGGVTEHEWMRVNPANASSQGNVGGSTWVNLYPSDSRPNNVNVEEDLLAGRMAGQDTVAGSLAESRYNTWREASLVLEVNQEVECIIAFGDDGTIDPNA